jgi:hypothetical protein
MVRAAVEDLSLLVRVFARRGEGVFYDLQGAIKHLEHQVQFVLHKLR